MCELCDASRVAFDGIMACNRALEAKIKEREARLVDAYAIMATISAERDKAANELKKTKEALWSEQDLNEALRGKVCALERKIDALERMTGNEKSHEYDNSIEATIMLIKTALGCKRCAHSKPVGKFVAGECHIKGPKRNKGR